MEWNRLKDSEVRAYFIKEGYTPLFKKYKDIKTLMKVKCPEGHTWQVRFKNFRAGARCKECYFETVGDRTRTPIEDVRSAFKTEGYKPLFKDFKSIDQLLKVRCPKGHIWHVRFNSFLKGARCNKCASSNHKAEKNCLKMVGQILPRYKVIENDRTLIRNPKTGRFLELDIYIPTLRKAIEFNGAYWHDNKRARYIDKQKVIQCKEKGIDLLVIDWQDWTDSRQESIEDLERFLLLDEGRAA